MHSSDVHAALKRRGMSLDSMSGDDWLVLGVLDPWLYRAAREEGRRARRARVRAREQVKAQVVARAL